MDRDLQHTLFATGQPIDKIIDIGRSDFDVWINLIPFALSEQARGTIVGLPTPELLDDPGGRTGFEVETDLHRLIQIGQRSQPSSYDCAWKLTDNDGLSIFS